ncbi:MAG: hypothetical protein AVDCRST_MAG41-3580, partial [uncultured Corynebacteriales bacterium]
AAAPAGAAGAAAAVRGGDQPGRGVAVPAAEAEAAGRAAARPGP